MRQTAEHQSYVGSTGVPSSYGLSPACHSMDHRSGFTLIEVVVAIAILLIVSIGFLRFSIVSYDWGTNIMIRSMAQNLAELTAEQLASSSISDIQSMILGGAKPNFPENGTGLSSVPSDGSYHVIAPGEFLVSGITSFFPQKSSQVDRPDAYGHIGVLDPAVTSSSPATQSGPVDSDLQKMFGSALPDIPSSPYSTFLYSLAPNATIEPMEHVDELGNPTVWDSGLVLFRTEFPRFLRDIKITPLFGGTPSDPTQVRYAYAVSVTWTFGVQKQMVSVAGERSNAF